MIFIGDTIYSIEFKAKGYIEYNESIFHHFDSNDIEQFYIRLRFNESSVHCYQMKVNKYNTFYVRMLLIEKKWVLFNKER